MPRNFASTVTKTNNLKPGIPNSDTVAKEQNKLINQFIRIVAGENDQDENREISLKLSEIIGISRPNNGTTREDRDESYSLLLNELKQSPDKLSNFMQAYAKMLNIAKRSRQVTNSEIFKDQPAVTADVFAYVLQKAQSEKVAPDDIARFFQSNAVAMFSLTAHPTNSTTTEYTKAALELDGALAAGDDVTVELQNIHNTEITGTKKTQSGEMAETILILDNIYAAIPQVQQNLANALAKHPQYRDKIDINKPLVKPCVWATGDGDGNDNATIASLTDGILLLRKRIKELYLEDLKLIPNTESLQKYLSGTSSANDFIALLDQKINLLKSPEYRKLNKTLAHINPSNTENQLATEIKLLQQLKHKVTTFGLHYAKIDIRHNSDDIMLTVKEVAVAAGLIGKSDELSETQLNKWLNDPQDLTKLRNTKLDNLINKKAANLFGRLQVIGQNPDMSDKFIIAETKSATNALAALLLLKTTRPQEAPIDMDIVTLSESVPDLEALPKIITNLINNQTYRAHIQHRGCVMPMIAKSDTVRRHGVGAATAQEDAIGQVYKIVEDAFAGSITVNGYNGGGCALQRGGGNVTEVAHNHGRAARRHNATEIGPSTLTIQGMQKQVLFSPGLSAQQTIEALLSQNLHAALQTSKNKEQNPYIKPRTASKSLVRDVKKELQNFTLTASDVEKMQLDRFKQVCNKTRASYFNFIGDPDEKGQKTGNPAFNELYKNGPWVSVNLGNLSSRPGKRGGGSGGNTAEDIKGKAPTLLDNRAITVERNSGHSGTHFLTYLGLFEGLKDYSTKDLHNMYRGSKSCRDLMRNTATSLHMTDFRTSWRMMLGQERPTDEIINELADNFTNNPATNPAERNAQTLAFIENYALKVAGKVYECIIGKAQPTKLNLKTTLETAWPDLAKQMAQREKMEEFAHFVEADITKKINQNPQMQITDQLTKLLQATYSACDHATNAPEGMMNTLTRTEEQEEEQAMSML